MDLETVKAMMIGSAVGDALGVPVEFMSREELALRPVEGMQGGGTHGEPLGTWSDDTSMTLCLLESLGRLHGIDYDDIMKNFVRWLKNAEFTATDTVFDAGIATQEAISRYLQGISPLSCGGSGEYDNGNGSLMRIAPLALFLAQKQVTATGDILQEAHRLSALTHGHPRSQMACGIYTLIAMNALHGVPLSQSIKDGLQTAKTFYEKEPVLHAEVPSFGRLWDVETFRHLPKASIRSSGYVVDTLEAVIWCLLNTANYSDAVLTAVNLGEDTDTIGAIVGGLAGATYGCDSIPSHWKENLLKIDLVEGLCVKFI